MASDKADGGRVECGEDGSALGRSLKPIPSEHIKAMTKTFRCYYNEGYVEADCTAQHELC
jgi:hypothetical protein